MKTIKKQYVLGFILICLLGLGLLIGGTVRFFTGSDYIETEATVVKVITRINSGADIEYRPDLVRYYVDGVAYETSVLTWFDRPIYTGDTMYVRYKKDNPTEIVVSNASRDTISYALIGIGGFLVVAGIALTGKYLYDAKRKKNV